MKNRKSMDPKSKTRASAAHAGAAGVLRRPHGHLSRAPVDGGEGLEVTARPRRTAEDADVKAELDQSRKELAAVADITDIAMQVPDLERMLAAILDRLLEIMAADSAAVMLRAADGVYIGASAGVSAGVAARVGTPEKMPPGGPADQIIATGKPLYVSDVQSDPGGADAATRERGVRSLLAVPMKRGDEVVGIIRVDWLTVHPLDDRETRLLEIIADRCGMAIVAAQLHSQVEDARQHAEELADIVQSERDILSATTESTGAHLAYLDADFTCLMVNPAYERSTGRSAEELIGRNYFEIFPDARHRAVFERVRKTGEAAEFKATPYGLGVEPGRAAAYWDWTLTPTKSAKGKVTGLALSLVDATERIRLKQLSDALNDIGSAILSNPDPDAIMQQIVVRAGDAMKSEGTLIFLRENDKWIVRHEHGSEKRLGLELADNELPQAVLAAKTARPVVIDDAYNDSRVNRKIMRRCGLRSSMVVPLLMRDETIGALSFTYRSLAVAFSDAEIDFANKLGASVSLALENARLYASIRQELSRTELLQDVALAATVNPDLAGIADAILLALNEHLHLRAGGVGVLDTDERSVRMIASIGYPKEMTDQPRHVPLTRRGSLIARAVHEKRLLTHSDDRPSAARQGGMPDDDHAKTRYVIVPIDYRGGILGAVSLAFAGRRDFTQSELELFESIGHVIGQAIENARLFDAEVRAQEQAAYELGVSRLLLEAAKALTRSLDTKEVLSSLADILLKATGKNRISINLVDRRKGALTVAAARPVTVAVGTTAKLAGLPPEFREALYARDSTLVDLAKPGTSRSARRYGARHNVRVALLTPLILGERLIGQIVIDEPGAASKFAPNEIKLVEGIASQAAVVLENARLHEGSVAKARSLESVSQTGSLITSTLRMDEALEQILDFASVLLGAASSLVLVLDREAQVYKVAARDGVSWKVARKTLSAGEVERLGLDRPVPVYMDDLAKQSQVSFFAANAREGFRSAVVASMYIDNKVDGLLIIQDRREISPSREDIAAFRLFTNQAATAIKNARVYEEERRIAEILQQSLAGPLPDIAGVDIGLVYKSAFQAERVGGDFYDVFELGDDLVAVLIGDVSGKGVRAAGLTETIRSSVRTLAYIDPSPAFVFSRLNHSLLRQLTDDTFATATLLVANKRTGEMRIANAGHPRPVVSGDECRFMKMPSGMLLGAFPEMYRESYFKIEPKQTIVLYTDGITEARRDGTMFGDVRLRRTLAAAKGLDPQTIVDQLLRAASRFARDQLSDDIALMAIRLRA